MKGTITNRDSFLNDIAKSLGRERKANVIKPNWSFNPQEEVLKDASIDELLEVFKEQCTKIHTKLIFTTKEQLSETLRGSIERLSGGPIVMWKDKRFEEFGLGTAFKGRFTKKQCRCL